MSYHCIVSNQNIIGKPARCILEIRNVQYLHDNEKISVGTEIVREAFVQPHLLKEISVPTIRPETKTVDCRSTPEELAKKRRKEQRKERYKKPKYEEYEE